MRASPRIVRTAGELREAASALLRNSAERGGRPGLGLVPTMGALHAGHAGLLSSAVRDNDVVIASIFVNPLQFGDAVDLKRYPRTLEKDLDVLAAAGVDLAFVPPEREMYPDGSPRVTVDAGALGEKLEGRFRPGHFSGMLTVVAKLLHLALPGVEAGYRAYFGQKDAQQLALIRRMVRDLNFPVTVVGVPTVRAEDGLALSSRNRFLSAEERDAALVLSRALRLLAERAARCEPLDLDSAMALVRSERRVVPDYFEVVDPATLEPLAFACQETPFTGDGLALIAATVGPVRLIDNMQLGG